MSVLNLSCHPAISWRKGGTGEPLGDIDLISSRPGDLRAERRAFTAARAY